MMKKIKFIPSSKMAKSIVDPPLPSSSKIPRWFKDLDVEIFKNLGPIGPTHDSNLTMKACPPVIDTMTTGYTITLDADVRFVDEKIYGHRALWQVSWPVIGVHSSSQIPKEMVPDGYHPYPFKWERSHGWGIETPPGYSLLYVHPFYRYDLPFISVPGIVDSDSFTVPANIPFFLKKDFIGTIEAGTPIAQVIPIKREPWKYYLDPNPDPENEYRNDNLRKTMYRAYKKRWWNKKTYK
jgi:hypothetical protein